MSNSPVAAYEKRIEESVPLTEKCRYRNQMIGIESMFETEHETQAEDGNSRKCFRHLSSDREEHLPGAPGSSLALPDGKSTRRSISQSGVGTSDQRKTRGSGATRYPDHALSGANFAMSKLARDLWQMLPKMLRLPVSLCRLKVYGPVTFSSYGVTRIV